PAKDADRPAKDADRPAKEKAPDWNVTKQPLTAEDGIQRLEDFLVEELEHATGRTMTQSSDSKPESQPITLPDERTPQEETSSPAPAVSDGISESTAITGTDSGQDAVAPTREILCQEIKWDDMLAAESAEDADKPTKDADRPAENADRPAENADRPAEEKRVQEPEHPAIDQGPAQVVLDTWPRITEPEIPVEETPAPAVNADRPAQPADKPAKDADKPASDTATLETGDKKGEGEQTKKPSEDDFKSFQDWLSGLLK
ncbi:hypothetical protein IBX73_09085, partial [candidate division WOR-3 bacterium]|nr:hypothetical protein [candidate division WOR-3 bacterium]